MSSFSVTNIDGRWVAELDGVNIASIIRDGTLCISFPPGGQTPLVSMQLIIQQVDVDLAATDVDLVWEDAR